MAAISNSTWKTVLAVAGVVLVIFTFISGYLIWGVALFVLLLVLGGGALLYRKAGPPER